MGIEKARPTYWPKDNRDALPSIIAIIAVAMSAWWGPASILTLVLAASAVLICSVIDYWRGMRRLAPSKSSRPNDW